MVSNRKCCSYNRQLHRVPGQLFSCLSWLKHEIALIRLSPVVNLILEIGRACRETWPHHLPLFLHLWLLIKTLLRRYIVEHTSRRVIVRLFPCSRSLRCWRLVVICWFEYFRLVRDQLVLLDCKKLDLALSWPLVLRMAGRFCVPVLVLGYLLLLYVHDRVELIP